MLASTEHALLHRLALAQRAGRAPSLVAGVVQDGALAWSGGRGDVDSRPADADTQYRIGSITKTFIAVLVLRLRDEGRLALTDPVGVHLPGSAFGDQTLAQLLTHTSGLTSELPGPWWERVAGPDFAGLSDRMAGEPSRYTPGTRFHYSNVGFGVLGEVVARLRGTSWIDAVRAELLQPLGLARTSFSPEPPHAEGWAVHPYADVLLPEPSHDAGAMAPAGQLWSTVTDLARWATFLGGDTGDVLSRATLEEMQRPATADDDLTGAMGLGLQVRYRGGRRLVGHGGSMPGFLAGVLFDLDRGTGVVALTNSTAGVALHTLSDQLSDTLEQLEPSLGPVWRPLPDLDQDLLALTGAWFWGPTPHVLRLAADGDLELRSGGSRSSRFRRDPAGADGVTTWTGLDGYYAGETLRVVRTDDGRVTHLDLATFVLTRTPYDPTAPVPGEVDPGGWRGCGQG